MYLLFNDSEIPFEEIARPGFSYSGDLTPNQGFALHFAEQWLGGRTEFTIHTSGSTGEPKPILWKRELMELSARNTLNALDIQPTDKIFLCLSVHTAGGLMMLVRGLMAGLPVKVAEPSGNPMEALPRDHDYTFASFVPLQMHHILAMQDFTSVPKLNRFRKVLIGGASMNNEWSRRFTDLDPEFYHTYGMTETYSHIALRKLNGVGATVRYVPLPGAQVSKDREERLVINGPITKYADIVTNDRVKIYPDGSFEILGRMDNIINSGGVKIQLEKVDDAIMRLKQFRGREFFTWYVPDEELGQKLITIIKGEPLEAMDEYEARVDLRSFLEKYEVPKQFFYTPHFILTESGKIQRQKTAELALKK